MRAWCLTVAMFLPALAGADRPATPWSQARTPADGPARSIGGYSAGCLQGGVALAGEGAGFFAAHPARVFGHPLLIDFIRALGARVRAGRLGALSVGDLGQPRG